jgi:hypothetical protein
MKKGLVITTLDYEIFGDGSGCVYKCLTEPTERILNIAFQHGVPVTIFAETEEIIRMEESRCHGTQVHVIKEQLCDALVSGHDVQLHVHPQWMGAEWDKGSWRVDNSMWRIADLTSNEMVDVLHRGKTWLCENLFNSKNNYECIAFRAGGWCIQPSFGIVKILRDLGLMIDSSVAPGMSNSAKGDWYDFRDASENAYWNSGTDILSEGVRGILEVPIAVGRVSKIQHVGSLLAVRLEKLLNEKECIGSYRGPNTPVQVQVARAKKLLDVGRVMLDYTALSSELLIDVVDDWIKTRDSNQGLLPIVAIGHSKNLTKFSEIQINRFFENINKREEIYFGSFQDWLNEK